MTDGGAGRAAAEAGPGASCCVAVEVDCGGTPGTSAAGADSARAGGALGASAELRC